MIVYFHTFPLLKIVPLNKFTAIGVGCFPKQNGLVNLLHPATSFSLNTPLHALDPAKAKRKGSA